MFGFNLMDIVMGVPITLIALTGHEFAHGWVSSKLGDPTPERDGRLTLNPMAHLDVIGTILMILTGFGWAKPVMVDPRYYKNRKRGMALTAIAGPLANLIMAFIAMLIFAVVLVVQVKLSGGIMPENASMAVQIVWKFAFLLAYRNLCFMVFNLIPIPPLDGSKVLGLFLPNRMYYRMLQYERYAIIIIMLLSISGAFNRIIGTGVNVVLTGMINLIDLIIGLIL
ncbi:MAG: site-2 protease family protein [Clostridia bacterium]|nr:site-2 protease family protein [Clostridia bacterium]